MDPVRSSSNNDTLVGSERWSFIKVMDILLAGASSKSLFDNMVTLTRRLQIPADTQMAIEHRLSTNTSSHKTVLYDILAAWRASKAKKANIYVLVHELEKCGLQDCAESLRQHMSQNEVAQSYLLLSGDEIVDRHSWNGLSEEFQTEIRDKDIIYQGKHMRIGKFTQNVHSLMDGKFLRQIINGETPTIVNNQVPSKLKYYIQRQVENRSILSKNIFKDRGEHVLVVQGLERHELTSLTNAPTDVSGNQTYEPTVRFILLELEEDFEKIAKVSKIPVHWIRFENGAYKWIKSSGSVAILQNYIDKDNQEKFDENELALTKHKVVLISDSPGMGKTQLLVNIAHEIMKQNDTLLVLFVVLQEFVPKLSLKGVDTETVISLIADMHSECEFGRKFVSHVLKSEPCIVLFDGFDEVLSGQVSSAKEALQVIKSLKKAQIFLTTRPHMRDELERTLHTLGYTIKPFSTSDQINFLQNCWQSNGIEKNESVHQFVEHVLNILTSNMVDAERDIAGIPLQCRMLAETYADDAERCSKLGFENYSDSSKIVTSVFKIYEQHINMRFENICKDETLLKRLFLFIMNKKNQFNIIKHAHMYYALKLLFPEQAEQFQKELCPDVPISLHDLCGLGILEATHQKDIRFVHQTFAEYLVAWFVMELEVNEGSKRFILSEILKTKSKKENFVLGLTFLVCNTVKSHEFGFPVISYFINGLAGKTYREIGNPPYQPPLPSLNYNRELLPVHFAAARQNYIYISIFASNLIRNKNVHKCNEKTMADLVFIAALHSDVNLLKIFCENEYLVNLPFPSVRYPGCRPDMVFTPLHVAVNRGHYNLVDYLITRYGKHITNLTHLIHICVHESLEDSQATVLEKIQIIKLLIRQSKQWLEESYSTEMCRTPLLQISCSPKLRECLIVEGANVNAIDENGQVVLHTIFYYNVRRNPMTPEIFHELVVMLIERGFKFFGKPDNKGCTPIVVAVKNIQLLPDTACLFFSNGVDFNQMVTVRRKMSSKFFWSRNLYEVWGDDLDEYSNGDLDEPDYVQHYFPLIFFAIIKNYPSKLIDLFKEFGADCKYVDQKQKTVLHYSVESCNVEALDYFLTNHELDVNGKDALGATALHYAVTGRNNRRELMQQLLIKAGTDLGAENSSKRTPFMEAFATANGLTLSTIHLMEEHGLNITKKAASKALNYFEKRLEKKPKRLKKFGNEIRYLWHKSGREDSDFPWELV